MTIQRSFIVKSLCILFIAFVVIFFDQRGGNIAFIIGKIFFEFVVMLGLPLLIGCVGYFKGGFSREAFNKSFWILFYIRIVLIAITIM